METSVCLTITTALPGDGSHRDWDHTMRTMLKPKGDRGMKPQVPPGGSGGTGWLRAPSSGVDHLAGGQTQPRGHSHPPDTSTLMIPALGHWEGGGSR